MTRAGSVMAATWERACNSRQREPASKVQPGSSLVRAPASQVRFGHNQVRGAHEQSCRIMSKTAAGAGEQSRVWP